jgi:complement component 1 Q subcomponent-binding protein
MMAMNIILRTLSQDSKILIAVRVIKKGGKNGILIDASSMDTSFEFNTIQYAEDINRLYSDYINQKAVDFYTGPAFNSLDERLQSEFTDFLTSVGINEELMSFMNVMSVDKDQRLYLGWLKNVQNFFS